ncbi:hypothetical protein [Brevundimonas sp. SL161]|uniref:hypothetical protein n=1 Tax=Brevundimonas sp. SL161 TaxID=2804613 RepID=UPI003CF4CC85
MGRAPGSVLIFAAALQACATTGASHSRLGLVRDVAVSAQQAGWVRLDPGGCILKPGTGTRPTTDDRECSGRIDLNGDGRQERLTTLYVFGRGSVLTLFDGDTSRVDPILRAEGYALMATTERASRGWPIVAVYGDPVSADELTGAQQVWTGEIYAPR